jgi:hypothetical protein
VLLEIETEIEQWLVQHTGMAQQESDQQAPDATVMVQKWNV